MKFTVSGLKGIYFYAILQTEVYERAPERTSSLSQQYHHAKPLL